MDHSHLQDVRRCIPKTTETNLYISGSQKTGKLAAGGASSRDGKVQVNKSTSSDAKKSGNHPHAQPGTIL